MSIVGGCSAIGLQGEQCNSSRHTDCWTLGQTSQCSGVVTALSALQRVRVWVCACVCVCVSTAQDGLGEKVPRLRPLNFTSGCCLAGSFDQMWKLRSRWRWQRPNCYGFPRSCTWICNPRVQPLSLSSSCVPAPCITTPSLPHTLVHRALSRTYLLKWACNNWASCNNEHSFLVGLVNFRDLSSPILAAELAHLNCLKDKNLYTSTYWKLI